MAEVDDWTTSPVDDWTAPPSNVNTLSDVAKSAGSGLAKGAIGLAGLPGDIGSLASNATSAAGSAFGVPPEHVQKFKDVVGGAAKMLPMTQAFAAGPTSDQLQSGVEKVTGKFYEPQTTAGKYASTIGEFAPAVIGGPESLATRIATRAVLPALASEGAGQLTEGTSVEPYARAAGALGAGSLGLKAIQRGIPKAAVPNGEDLFAAKDAAYNHPDVTGLRIKSDAAETLSDNIQKSLLANKVDVKRAPTVAGILDDLKTSRFGQHHTIDDFDLARQSLSDVPFEEKRAATIARRGIDNYLGGNIPQSDVVAGNAAAANSKLLEARANFSAMKRDEEISNALGRAENQAGSTYSGGNLENATRQQLRPILNEKQGVAKKKQMFQDYTPEELAALNKAVNGTAYGNVIRNLAKTLGSGGGMGNLVAGVTGGEAAHYAGADPLSSVGIGLATGLAGRGLGAYGARLAANRGNAVGELLRKRSPAYQANVAATPVVAQSNPSQVRFTNALMALRALRESQNTGQ